MNLISLFVVFCVLLTLVLVLIVCVFVCAFYIGDEDDYNYFLLQPIFTRIEFLTTDKCGALTSLGDDPFELVRGSVSSNSSGSSSFGCLNNTVNREQIHLSESSFIHNVIVTVANSIYIEFFMFLDWQLLDACFECAWRTRTLVAVAHIEVHRGLCVVAAAAAAAAAVVTRHWRVHVQVGYLVQIVIHACRCC